MSGEISNFPLLNDMSDVSKSEDVTNFATTFQKLFNDYSNQYKRKNTFSNHLVQPIKKSHGVGKNNFLDHKIQRLIETPVICTFA